MEEVKGKEQQQHQFVLVHGMGHGAWCWYKVVTLLKQRGHHVIALDLTSNGINNDALANEVKSLAAYSSPLLQYLDALENEKVIVVGHSLGGCILSYAMEKYPHRISKAIFIASFMPRNNQTYLGSAFPQTFPRLVSNGVVKLNYSGVTGLEQPSSVSFNLEHAKEYLYKESPPEDASLAECLLRATPYPVAEEVLQLTDENYGSVRRMYVMTMEDKLFPPQEQEQSIGENPPQRVFRMEGSDHSPFFSRPLQLSDLLESIANL